ncbi:hypothetical protein C8J57DRAFT_1252434 [Mycena rebaudengoi]|nr:hypothetical protein C8J57DRAFT_1252434 [Mycena rebaudengoi]
MSTRLRRQSTSAVTGLSVAELAMRLSWPPANARRDGGERRMLSFGYGSNKHGAENVGDWNCAVSDASAWGTLKEHRWCSGDEPKSQSTPALEEKIAKDYWTTLMFQQGIKFN